MALLGDDWRRYSQTTKISRNYSRIHYFKKTIVGFWSSIWKTYSKVLLDNEIYDENDVDKFTGLGEEVFKTHHKLQR